MYKAQKLVGSGINELGGQRGSLLAPGFASDPYNAGWIVQVTG